MKNEQSYLCFGGIDWWYHSRAHIDPQITRRFALRGKTLYVNSIVMTKFKTGEKKTFWKKVSRKLKSIFTGLKKTEEGFWVYSPFTMPVHHIKWAKMLNDFCLYTQIKLVTFILGIKNPVILVANPAAVDVAMKLKKKAIAYQRTDRFEEAAGVDVEVIGRCDQRLKKESDLTIFVNTKLYEEEHKECKKSLFLDHGVDYDFFSNAEKDEYVPADIADIERPVVGYFGAIFAHSVDIELMEEVAKLLPEISFVFVGTLYEEYGSLFDLKNVHSLGQKDYAQIPHYGKCFDVCILPWAKNRWTEASNPIKIKEYLALGKPVVSTPYFSEVDRFREVMYLASTAAEFAECIEIALSENNSDRIVHRRNFVKTSSWDSKAQLLLDSLLDKD